MVRLEKVTNENVWQITKLRVAKTQEEFVASNTESLVEAYIALSAGGVAYPFGIYDDDMLVGFVMIGYGTDEDWVNPPEIAKDNYSIWRLMIDENFQGKGYGKKAVELALDFIKTLPNGESEYVYLSYEPENKVAKMLYQSMGFEETGDMDGEELIAVKKI